ncbi:SDR family oxidoreductase [Staphylococcus carnosus]|uniref:NAD(P)-binding domain-containing protein n=2 Tax=Staphylococcus carnosus TaxID=1281 RepID=B9DMA7_STACT|nr:SDR family oxidoreductase [Staphylococcus carnosus]KKB24467.1 oxidoreductase [Staphylococcus carnosus]PNZ97624.1 oxidoreductase [Staphylococcus carnosus]QPT04648.1 SDR family oxidoreductase [Staphylococcus carnosus]QQS84724.1 SDR family oxidoreductase [Staphylococcus carnosus]QRQ04662.1 SDR family oxidoreductase [Staphylococcus carnosus]
MSILVLGANGGVGKQIVSKLKEENKEVSAAYRKDDQVDKAIGEGYDARNVDVEKDEIEKLADKFKGFDQVVFSVGSGGNTGDDKTIIIDLDGAVKAIEASKKAGVKHFVMVSTYDSSREAFDSVPELKAYTIAKHYADNHLRDSGLFHTIVHPGALENGPGTGNVDIAKHFDGGGSVPREDVASVIVDVLENEKFQGGEFQVISGSEPIEDALENFYKKQ